MDKMTLRDVELKGKRVVMRVDFNVPMAKDGSGKITVENISLIIIYFVAATLMFSQNIGNHLLSCIKKYNRRDVYLIFCCNTGNWSAPSTNYIKGWSLYLYSHR